MPSNKRSYYTTHAEAALYDMARHTTLRHRLQKGTDNRSGKGFDQFQRTINYGGRQRNSPGTVKVIRTRVRSQTFTATPTRNASAVVQIGPSPHSIYIPATPSTNGSRVPYDYSVRFVACVWRSHFARPNG